MAPRSGHDETPETSRVAVFERERIQLLSVASRILGSQSDAEDVVQETWIRFDCSETDRIENVPAWLTTVATRLCVDSLRRRREISLDTAQLLEEKDDEPNQSVLLAEELTAAFTVVVGELTPPQRVALVLHDAFGLPFDEVAHILDTTTGSAKKLASRARKRIRQRGVKPNEDDSTVRPVVAAFLRAVQEGDTDRLVALLDPNVLRTADPQVLPPGAAQRIDGIQAVAAETRTFQANARRARLAIIDGRPGIVVPREDSGVQAVLILRVHRDRIVHYDVVADPRRLALLEIR